MRVPLYDLFSGHPKRDPTWLEALDSLTAANHGMEECARENRAVLHFLPH
jgi:hypothetical protein